MNRIDSILKKERSNTDRIFLYLLDNRFMAFDRSAYYATLLYPRLQVTRGKTDVSGAFVCLCIPFGCLCKLIEKYYILADDDSIRITPPLNISRQRNYFDDWQKKQVKCNSQD